MRVVVDALPGGRDADQLHELDSALLRILLGQTLVDPEHLPDLPPHREDRVQR